MNTAALIWAVLLVAVLAALGAASLSPLLAWRDSVYISACMAGIVAFSLLAFQPLLALRLTPASWMPMAPRWHRWVGVLLVLSVLVHVIGLWLTSPPDVIDALLFDSPTPFSRWGVIAMWAIFASASLVLLRKRLSLSATVWSATVWSAAVWRLIHQLLALVIVLTSVAHALMIDGLMEPLSKSLLSALITLAALGVLARLLQRPWR